MLFIVQLTGVSAHTLAGCYCTLYLGIWAPEVMVIDMITDAKLEGMSCCWTSVEQNWDANDNNVLLLATDLMFYSIAFRYTDG